MYCSLSHIFFIECNCGINSYAMSMYHLFITDNISMFENLNVERYSETYFQTRSNYDYVSVVYNSLEYYLDWCFTLYSEKSS